MRLYSRVPAHITTSKVIGNAWVLHKLGREASWDYTAISNKSSAHVSGDTRLGSDVGRTYILAFHEAYFRSTRPRSLFAQGDRFERAGIHSWKPTVETVLRHKPSGDSADIEALCDKHHFTYREDIRRLVIPLHVRKHSQRQTRPRVLILQCQ